MESVSTADARKNLAELMNRAAYGGERFVVTRHGKELVAIVPLEDADLLARLRRFVSRKELERALQEADEEGTTSWQELKSEMGL